MVSYRFMATETDHAVHSKHLQFQGCTPHTRHATSVMREMSRDCLLIVLVQCSEKSCKGNNILSCEGNPCQFTSAIP